jgi:hypothetical protein
MQKKSCKKTKMAPWDLKNLQTICRESVAALLTIDAVSLFAALWAAGFIQLSFSSNETRQASSKKTWLACRSGDNAGFQSEDKASLQFRRQGWLAVRIRGWLQVKETRLACSKGDKGQSGRDEARRPSS